MKTRYKFILLVMASVAIILYAFVVGSVDVSLTDIFYVLQHKITGGKLPQSVEPTLVSILWSVRLPRILTAFAVGALLSVSGLVLQSVLGNPMASSFTLGVSSGASLGAAIVFSAGVSILGVFTLPIVGFASGLLTVLLAIAIATGIDKNLKNNTIILVGMVFSMFVNSILMLVNALHKDTMQRLMLWQMGSFASKTFSQVAILWGVAAMGLLLLSAYANEMDILTFGDEQSRAIGLETGKIKMYLLVVASFLTGTAVSFTGTIGFVDLIVPHMVRKLFGDSHKVLIPAVALFGGSFMVFADIIARVAIQDIGLPIGAVTALIGAPIFIWIYAGKNGKNISAIFMKKG